ncbi:hypothetical protein THASP1DRAFT_25953 [Thamnocephalis sphaerospora]|uniref:YncI copper-binding domain-containing protein n=1 Tax=Thamnocephalis sphaerospora TaxID=78915 RepID=A0A4V1IVX4_9FUNG|nr:hypothetical protein THASP1DRAFT_25953 [Thamnocephalis sphaerospora]|eukprot:RKP05569.1 hypothetical protein THASP1DRAFT_25953 [Thamnocephalis sphaerospora]
MKFFTAAFAAVAAAALVDAHISITPPTVAPNTYTSLAFRIPHGCDGSPTKQIEIKIPTNTSSVKGQHIPGWVVTTTTRPLEVPFTSDGKLVNTTVDTVTWSADPAGNNTLPDSAFMDFAITIKTPSKGDDSGKVFFPIAQTCVNGSSNWTETGANSAHPAAALKLGATAASGATSASSTGGLAIASIAALLTAAYLL